MANDTNPLFVPLEGKNHHLPLTSPPPLWLTGTTIVTVLSQTMKPLLSIKRCLTVCLHMVKLFAEHTGSYTILRAFDVMLHSRQCKEADLLSCFC